MRSRHIRRLRLATMIAVSGMCFQLGSCSLGDVFSYITNINPCGTIMTCDPGLYDLAVGGYEGPGADPDLDPFCTWPPYCDPGIDPIGGGGFPAAGG